MKKIKKNLIIDRDGTIIKHIPYLSDPDLVKLVPGVKNVLKNFVEYAQEFVFSND